MSGETTTYHPVLASLKADMALLPLPWNPRSSSIGHIFRPCDMEIVRSYIYLFNKMTNTSSWIDIGEIVASVELQALYDSNLGATGRTSMTCVISRLPRIRRWAPINHARD